MARDPRRDDRRRDRDRGRQLRDVGIYTAIPMMLVAGPALGYLLGLWAAGRWGHETAFTAGGMFLGLLAAVRQIWLLLDRSRRS
jgi:hypothetical protein